MPADNNYEGMFDNRSRVERLGFRVPVLIPNEPKLWFNQLERSFDAAAITTEATRFSHLCSALDPRYAVEIKDLIANPPTEHPYSRTKAELLNRLSVSQEAKNRQLLEDQTLGDRKPSQFLRHLQNLAGGSGADKFVRTIWLSRLPTAVQAILSTQQHQSLDKIAELADGIMETLRLTQPFSAFTAPSPQPTWQLPPRIQPSVAPEVAAMAVPILEQAIAAITVQLTQLSAKVDSLERNRSGDNPYRSRVRARSQSRPRRRSQSRAA